MADVTAEVIPVTLVERRTIAERTTELALAFPKGFDFRAGQYLNLRFPGTEHGLGDDSRDLSIASSPAEPGLVRVAYRDSDSAFKRRLVAASPGDSLTAEGPLGHFCVPKRQAPLALLAGGIGIVPFRAMVLDPLLTERDFTLFAWNKTAARAAYVDDFAHLPNVSTVGSFSAGGIKQWHREHPQGEWLISGPPAMVHRALDALARLEVRENRIRTEEFTGYSGSG